MPTLGNALDFAKYEARNIRGHQLGAAPSSPVSGQLYYNTSDNTLYWFDGTSWQSAKGGTGTPTGAAGGDLSGTYPNPSIAVGVIVDTDVNAANKDGAVGTPSMRTLGPGAQQAAPGNDARFTDARAPTAHKATHEPGGSDPLTVDAAAATGSLRTLGLTGNKAMPGTTTLDAVPSPTSSVNMNNQRLNLVGDPTLSTDAANKKYVDGLVSGLDAKASVKCASTGNLGLSGLAAIDGVTPADGDRVLVKDQTTPSQNGIYWAAPVAWTRVSDADTWAELPGSFVFVEQGSTQADTGWVCSADQGGTLGTTAVTWVQFSAAGQIIGGAGLVKTSNTLDVGAGPGITVNADTVQVANNGITNAMLADGAVDLASADVTGLLPLTKGGTGADASATVGKASARANLAAAGYYGDVGPNPAGTTITIPQSTHGLRASRGLQVQVQNASDGVVVIPDVAVAANGDVTITFGASQGLNSKIVTIVG